MLAQLYRSEDAKGLGAELKVPTIDMKRQASPNRADLRWNRGRFFSKELSSSIATPEHTWEELERRCC